MVSQSPLTTRRMAGPSPAQGETRHPQGLDPPAGLEDTLLAWAIGRQAAAGTSGEPDSPPPLPSAASSTSADRLSGWEAPCALKAPSKMEWDPQAAAPPPAGVVSDVPDDAALAFDRIDANRDGVITREEWRHHATATPGERTTVVPPLSRVEWVGVRVGDGTAAKEPHCNTTAASFRLCCSCL